ncbi:MAG: hypothetical protein JNK40_13455 [Chromatiales bacterium]|nr:hypothetical protein [Chromatiales bacterium]
MPTRPAHSRSRSRTVVVPIALLTAVLSPWPGARADCTSFSGFAPEGFGYPNGGFWGAVAADYEPDIGERQNIDDLRQVDGPRVPLFDVTVATETVFNSSASVVGKLGRGYVALDVLAIARASGAPAGTDAHARGAAAFNDTITISAPGRNGQPGTVRLGVQVDGVLSAARSQSSNGIASSAYGNGGAAYRFDVTDGSPGPGGLVSVGAGFVDCEAAFVQIGGFPIFPPAEPVGQVLGGVVNFTYGAPITFNFQIEVALDSDASVSEPGFSATATLVGDFGNTASWTGILDLKDQTGNAVTDFTVTSVSGTDYRHAILGIDIAPRFGTEPADASVAAGQTATFTATAGSDGTPLTLQWAVSTDNGVTWSGIPGATGTSYTTPATTLADDGRRYRLTATNDVGSTDSAAALLTVSGGGSNIPVGGGGSSRMDGASMVLLMLLALARRRRRPSAVPG